MERPSIEIDIDKLIQYLKEQKEKGNNKVTLSGKASLHVNSDILLTTESQW